MKYIKETNVKFDYMAIWGTIKEIVESGAMDAVGARLFVNHPKSTPLVCTAVLPSPYDQKTNTYTTDYSEAYGLNEMFVGSYIESVISTVENIMNRRGYELGRVRVLRLRPLQAYQMHRDADGLRFHVPLKTNSDVYFINEKTVDQMLELGKLYEYETSSNHSAYNLSLTEDRYHLVFDTKPLT